MRMKRAREPKQTVCNISNIHRKTKQFIYNSNDHSGVCAKESVCFRCLESARSVSYWSELFLFVVVFCLLRECLAYITPFIIHHLIKIHIKQTQKRKMIRSFTYEEFFHCCCCFSLVGDFFSLPPLRPNKYKFYALKYSAWDFRLLLLYSVHARVDIFYYKFTVLEVLSERNALFLSLSVSVHKIYYLGSSETIRYQRKHIHLDTHQKWYVRTWAKNREHDTELRWERETKIIGVV